MILYVHLGDEAQRVAARIANDLRLAGFLSRLGMAPMSLKAHMKTADKIGASKVIMIGDEELNRNGVTIRDMSTKEQLAVRIDDLVGFFQGESL